jgi:hypothetical protein
MRDGEGESARRLWPQRAPHERPVQAGNLALPFLVEQTRAGQSRATGGRYVGHSSGARPASARASAARPSPLPPSLPGRTESPVLVATTKAKGAAWSLRLVVTVAIICVLGVGWRLMGLFTPPVDSPVGREATHGALVSLLSGQTVGSLDTLRFSAPIAPWRGELIVSPDSGFPLYDWLCAGLIQLTGLGDWTARVVSVFFAVLAGLGLFALVRREAGARAALYSLLFYAFAPLSIVLGQQFSPSALILAVRVAAMLALVRWGSTLAASRPQGSPGAFTMATVAGAFASLLDPGSVLLIVPAFYLSLTPELPVGPNTSSGQRVPGARRTVAPGGGWRDAWARSQTRGRLYAYSCALLGIATLWWLIRSGDGAAASPSSGASNLIAALFSGSTYVQLVGLSIEQILSVLGLLLLILGFLNGARSPRQYIIHFWALGALLQVLLSAAFIGQDTSTLSPLLLPACALVGVGAAWAGSLPARMWIAFNEQRRENDSSYAVSPHTSWLLDLPEEPREQSVASRPQAQLALGKTVADRSRRAAQTMRRTWYMGVGHFAVLGLLLLASLSGWRTTYARLQPNPDAVRLAQAGQQVALATPFGSRLIIVGPSAPELFYASQRTGWAISREDLGIAAVQSLQREGADYLLTTDQEWLGHHPDYVGLLANYSVLKLARDFILFDLSTKPSASDRLYFLESGHTLGGAFRQFWEKNGGVQMLGYPISEEVEEGNPLDGQVRTIQYFERAVLEAHPEFVGTPDAVMRAAVGRWVTQGRDFPRTVPFASTTDHVYFPQTSHGVKEAFLRFWQSYGGLAVFGYPISEELPEISPLDGKVYTVQYFERARFEWHPTEAGTPNEVQLGLIGKQALEMRK